MSNEFDNESHLRDLLNRVVSTLKAADQLQNSLFNNNNYLPHFTSAQNHHLLGETLLTLQKQQEILASTSENFLTPSYSAKNRRSSF